MLQLCRNTTAQSQDVQTYFSSLTSMGGLVIIYSDNLTILRGPCVGAGSWSGCFPGAQDLPSGMIRSCSPSSSRPRCSRAAGSVASAELTACGLDPDKAILAWSLPSRSTCSCNLSSSRLQWSGVGLTQWMALSQVVPLSCAVEFSCGSLNLAPASDICSEVKPICLYMHHAAIGNSTCATDALHQAQ